jgi:hypothetical protein
MNGINKLFLISISTILASCAIFNQSPSDQKSCQNADWQAIGMKDGYNGWDTSYLQKHSQACAKHDVNVDAVQYQAGYAAGLEQFCSVGKGYWLGESGQEYKNTCPAELSEAHLEAYENGRRVFNILQEMD